MIRGMIRGNATCMWSENFVYAISGNTHTYTYQIMNTYLHISTIQIQTLNMKHTHTCIKKTNMEKPTMSRFHLVSIELVESRQHTALTGNVKKLRGPWGFMYISLYGKCIQWIFQVPVKGGR